MEAVTAYRRDPRVDQYLDSLPRWQRDLGHRLRDLIHAADPEIAETIKRTVLPYFVLEGNVCALLAAKDHVNLFHTNKTARMISFHEGDAINESALTAMLRQIAANNRTGGWRKLKRP